MTAAVSPSAIDALCPMHVQIGPDGSVLHAGPTIRKVLGDLEGRALFDILRVERPAGIASLADLRKRAGRKLHVTAFVAPHTPLVGHAVCEVDGGALLDLGFGIGVADAVRRHGITGSDVAPTDLTMEILFLIEAQGVAMTASRMLNLKLQSARIAAEAEAATDKLTGLANRRALELTLDALIEDEAAFGLIHLDLDHFKQVNDTHGHAAGDIMLCEVAATLTGTIRPHDIAARIGGDEFLLIFPNLSDALQLAALCDRLIEKITIANCEAVPDARVSASAGIAIWAGGPGADPAEMIARADRALYASKRAGRSRATLAWADLDSPPPRTGTAP
ncbi:diguanylate cyclase [Roseivivax lentus]|uniref:diguanylate cyclase n=1 Tax=Roseivivax lentus TaxID=633194 RepID=A0A1N7PPE3_9RHOB|nr:GGDEF domain-containing protein [Roseivivax lentus]SIT12259.1 diguanylate cyclase [Roseivivax lentus]